MTYQKSLSEVSYVLSDILISRTMGRMIHETDQIFERHRRLSKIVGECLNISCWNSVCLVPNKDRIAKIGDRIVEKRICVVRIVLAATTG